MKTSLQVVVIADDLTGAADTGAQFCPVAGPVHLTSTASLEGIAAEITTEALAVFTGTRNLSRMETVARIKPAAMFIKRFAPRTIYKKMDSCLRGNLGAELDALVEILECQGSLVAPALPAQGRTTINDIHQVNGVPVAETEIRHDPHNPVTESRLSRLLASQSQLPVAHLPLDIVDQGPERIRAVLSELLAADICHIACDAVSGSHLDALAAASRAFPNLLVAGSAGLAHSLAHMAEAKIMGAAPKRINRMLWVCGSASATLAAQLAHLKDRTGIAPLTLPAEFLARGLSRQAIADMRRHVTDGWAGGVRILCIEPGTPAAAPLRLLSGLTDIATDIIANTDCDGVFMTGGDTAEALWQRLGATAVQIMTEILPGVIGGRWIGGILDGKTAVTKAGAFGGVTTLYDLYQILIEKGYQ